MGRFAYIHLNIIRVNFGTFFLQYILDIPQHREFQLYHAQHICFGSIRKNVSHVNRKNFTIRKVLIIAHAMEIIIVSFSFSR